MTSKIVVNNIEADAGISTVTFVSEVTAPTFNGNIVGTSATFSGNVNVAGVLTYEDVTSVDAVGLSTFQNGIHVTGGSVGIGTDNPGNKLHLGGTVGLGIRIQDYTSGEDGYLTIESGTNLQSNISGSGYHTWHSGGGEKLRLTNDGKLILKPGADSGNILQLNGADTTSEILEAGITSGHVQFTATYASGGSNTCGFIFRTRGGGSTTEKVRITSSGNVGIGTDSPYSNASFNSLSVGGSGKYGLIELVKSNGVAGSWIDSYGTSGDGNLRFTTAGTSGAITFWTGGEFTEKVRITSSGNVGIGSTIPQSSLDVAGEVRASGIAITTSYPTIAPSLNLNFARSRALDPRITFTRASTATYVDSNGFVRTAGDNEPRFDHDPETGESLGLLLEGTRTNQLGTHNGTYAGNYRQTNQGLNTTGPDGVTNSAREFTVNSDGGTGGSTLISANTNLGVNGTTKSWSCFLKVTRSNSIAFQFYDNNNNLTSDVYTLYANGSDPVYQSAGNNGSTRVDKYPNGWYRFRWEGFVGSSNNTSYLQIYSQSHISSDGSNVGYAIWGQSFETGHRCSSPILTTSGSVTRVKESVTILGGNFDSFYNDNEWTVDFVYRIRTVEPNGGNYRLWDINNDTNDGRIGALYSPNSHMAYFGFENGGTSFSSDDVSYNVVIDQEYHGALAYSPTSTIAFLPGAGTLGSEDTTVALDGPTQLQIGNWYGDDRPMYGTIAKLVYYPKRLSNAELLALTSNV